MVSYELALGLAFVVPILLAGSMSVKDIVDAQSGFANWYVWKQPLGFLILFIASLAEINRAPFDEPEAEQELVAGFHTEYSGMKFALFFMAEYIKMIAVSAIAATFFLGGYYGPFVEQLPLLFLREAHLADERRLLGDLLRHARLGDALLELADLGGAVVALAELLADRAQLLAQQRLALALVHGLLRALADRLRQPQDLHPVVEQRLHPVEALGDVGELQDLLLLAGLEVQVTGHRVGQRAGLADRAVARWVNVDTPRIYATTRAVFN
jgi:hypothetical protein